jgi:hypothetical protein
VAALLDEVLVVNDIKLGINDARPNIIDYRYYKPSTPKSQPYFVVNLLFISLA